MMKERQLSQVKHGKRFLCALLACCMILALTACGGDNLKTLLPFSRTRAGEDASTAIPGSQTVTFPAQNGAASDDALTGSSFQITIDGDTVTVVVRGAVSGSIVWEGGPKTPALPD